MREEEDSESVIWCAILRMGRNVRRVGVEVGYACARGEGGEWDVGA